MGQSQLHIKGEKFLQWCSELKDVLRPADKHLAVVGVLIGIVIGWITAVWLANATMDGGIATLAGSMLGSAITVAGALALVGFERRANQLDFERFVGEVIVNIRAEAFTLLALTTYGYPTADEYAAKFKGQIAALKEALGIFDRSVAVSNVNSYRLMRWISRVRKEIADNEKLLDRELSQLNNDVTYADLLSRRANFSGPANALYLACTKVLNELGSDVQLPTDAEIDERFDHFRD